MQYSKSYSNYPIWIVIVSNAHSFSIYAAGFLILLRLSYIPAALYLVYLLILEIRIITYHCVNCYYWGKTCSFGKGRISSFFFKKGSFSKFCENNFSWKDMVPDMLVSIIPVITGIILLAMHFKFFLLFLLLLIVFFSSYGNSYVRGKLACRHCKQRELGCPAYDLFNPHPTSVDCSLP